MPNRLQVKLYEEEDGGTGCEIHLELALESNFKKNQYRTMGRRRLVRKYIDLACRMLVKNIKPQIEEALRNEQRFFDLSPEEKEKAIAAAFAKQEAAKDAGDDAPAAPGGSTGLNSALAGGSAPGDDEGAVPGAGGADNPEVPETDQKPNNSD